ncbi:DUF1772 domain-containing protein [Phyllobacterium zundukense]|jgi:hypothetical protein|uniref:DUF1772 domain-containing protein n=1 Tax=Phyllobacterium zundukense TaxID=1867719 RepID=A0ACD4D7I4_9HYPH|nr:DUF1772 domain-containing protein [Phyllobacterium zundukense]UXN61815.1 DUF1772 domain-containing protein [Phyllobacterium zundukense]
MDNFMHILSLLLVAVAMGLSLAHALEFPGKKRLDKDTYSIVQPIYYPGFTLGGLVGEFGGIVALAILLFILPYGTSRFWWSAIALACLVVVNLIYWTFTHRVNNFWLRDTKLSGAGNAFFSSFAGKAGKEDWKQFRDIWEYSHVARAVFAMLSLVSIAIALTA